LNIPASYCIPNADEDILPGVKWGRCEELFTPAYWKIQYHLHLEDFCPTYYRIGNSLIEEICACLLGGYGMPSELGLAAFKRLRDSNLLRPGIKHQELLSALLTPFNINGRIIKYRFPNQKANFLNSFLNGRNLSKIPVDNDLQLREWLLTVQGIGMKTASWIVRNWLSSNNVAILDIHIHRAGMIAGFFSPEDSIIKDYELMEKKYLAFSNALKVDPANLDSLIWLQLKMANSLAINILKQKK